MEITKGGYLKNKFDICLQIKTKTTNRKEKQNKNKKYGIMWCVYDWWIPFANIVKNKQMDDDVSHGTKD